MKRIAIFSGSQTGLDEFQRIIEHGLGDADCSLTLFSDPKKLMNFLFSSVATVDVVLFDLCRQNQSYIRLANTITKTCPDIDLLYISKPYYFYMDEGSPTQGSVYVLSTPIFFDDLEKPLARAVTTLTRYESGKLTLFTNGQVHRMRHSQIDYIVSNNRQLTIHGESELCIYGKLDDMEGELGEDFLRCHQSYLVNINRILEFGKLGIWLTSGVRIPVSKSRYEKAHADFLRYTGCKGLADCGCK